MGTRDPRIDAYIAKSPDFAKPILKELREIVHTACPAVEETLKWSSPFFMYNGVLCRMAAFKEHCAFGFWKHGLVIAETDDNADGAAGEFGRITKLSDLPSKKVLSGYIKQAMKLNDDGVKLPPRVTKAKKELAVPGELTAALKKNKKAQTAFDAFSPSKQREYAEWIADAKSDDTRKRRLETAIEWISEGKSRHWKYQNS
ncbi:MAG: YdeI/OmpD-associated family protein [Gemmatimonadota bacterium]|nr:YdeI/OmpD-associated family protein [Gemmatimonadota bacterium]